MTHGLRHALLLLLALPLLAAAAFWTLGFTLLDDTGLAHWVTLAPLILAPLVATAWTLHRGATWRAPLWGLATLACTAVFFIAGFFAVLAVAGDDGDTGCPDGRIYC